MPAAYDNYDYPSYWKGREYEHKSEAIALKQLISRIKNINKIIEIGAGFGRLLPIYQFRAKKITLSDPSLKLISMAKRKYSKNKKVEFVQSSLATISDNKRAKSYDLCIMVRVLHHIEDIDDAFSKINKLLKNGGYFILEFPNKNNLKSNLRHFLKGDFTFPINTNPIDLRSKKNIRKKTLPFINYHPDHVINELKENGFEIVEVRSVSNIRSTLLKKIFPSSFLLDVEKILQVLLSKVSFGPSLFILSRKRGD